MKTHTRLERITKNTAIPRNTMIPRITLALVALVIMASAAYAAGTPRVVVADYSTDGPAVVGGDVTLNVHLRNVGAICALTTTVRVQANAPFITRTGTFGPFDICGNATVSIPLRVDASATAGSYPLTLTMDYNDLLTSAYSASETITIDVRGSPSLTARVAGSEPVDVYAGDTATMTIALDNVGTYEAQSVNGTLTVEAPLEVGWSQSTMAAGSLAPRASTQSTFSVKVPKDAKAGDYGMELMVYYLDENRLPVGRLYPLVFHVKSKALFDAKDGVDTIYPNDQRKLVHLTLTNTGTDTARNLKIKVQPQYPFTTDGSIRFVDTLAPGQNVPVEFVVNVDKDGTAGKYGLDLVVDFEDAQGNLLHDNAKLALTLSEKSTVRKVFIDYWYLWLTAAAIIVWRLASGKKKKHA